MDKQKSDVQTEDFAEKKRRERLEQNRVSAMESRKRKKTMIEELQISVIDLSKENKTLSERNETLRKDLIDLGTKYPNVLPLHSLMGLGFQAQNLNPAGFPMNNSSTPIISLSTGMPSSNGLPNPTPEAMLQINNSYSAYLMHQQLAAKMMNDSSITVENKASTNPAIAPTVDVVSAKGVTKKSDARNTRSV